MLKKSTTFAGILICLINGEAYFDVLLLNSFLNNHYKLKLNVYFGLLNFVFAVLIISVIVVFHELGHYFVARMNNAEISDFAIGFGPEVISFVDSRKTKWSFRLIPFGGYVCCNEESMSFLGKLFLYLGGPIGNLFFAMLISLSTFMYFGDVKPIEYYEISSNPSYVQNDLNNGVRVVDIIQKPGSDGLFVKLSDGNEISGVDLLLTRFRERASCTRYAVLRLTKNSDTTSSSDIILHLSNGSKSFMDSERMLLKKVVVFEKYRKIGLVQAVYKSFTSVIIKFVKNALGLFRAIFDRSARLSGPIDVLKNTREFLSNDMFLFCQWVIALSIGLAVINLLPILPLDGGRVLILAIDLISKRLANIVANVSIYVGFVLMGFVLFKDVKQVVFLHFMRIFEFFRSIL
ncbi:MAG: site-2 protease family protein [Alphaproteobacteria bacterium]|nr:MAG: site-2 protease family protein [Alphaproteobacteria bacterium]